jgi:hypothetical protein
MAETKHTPGPWRAHLNAPTAAIPWHLIETDDDVRHPVALLWEGGGTKGKPRQIANAYLVAEAPTMLSALKAQHEAIDILFAMLIESRPGFLPTKSGRPWEAALLGNATIAKAEGRSDG